MTAALPTPLLARLPRGGRWLLGLVVPLSCATGDDRKQYRLQPGRRRAAAVLPLVSGGAWTTEDADNLRRGNVGNGFLEGHAGILPQKKKCAMQKTMLAMHTRKGHLSRVSQPHDQMKKELEAKITALLAIDSPSNYMYWEDAEESILDELTDEESEEYTNEGCSMVEEWFAANEEENEEDEDEA